MPHSKEIVDRRADHHVNSSLLRFSILNLKSWFDSRLFHHSFVLFDIKKITDSYVICWVRVWFECSLDHIELLREWRQISGFIKMLSVGCNTCKYFARIGIIFVGIENNDIYTRQRNTIQCLLQFQCDSDNKMEDIKTTLKLDSCELTIRSAEMTL